MPAAQAKGPVQEWEIEQICPEIGHMVIRTGSTGSSFTSLTISLIAPAGDPFIYVANSATKRYLRLSYAKFKEEVQILKFARTVSKDPFSPWKEVETSKICGVTAHKRVRSRHEEDGLRRTYVEEEWYTKDILVAKQLARTMRTLTLFSFDEFSPLREKEIVTWKESTYGNTEQKRVTVHLDTLKIIKRQGVPSDCSVPKDYTETTDESDVMTFAAAGVATEFLKPIDSKKTDAFNKEEGTIFGITRADLKLLNNLDESKAKSSK